MPKVIKAYRCAFCRPGKGRAYISQSHAKAHEARCYDNPATRSCATCRFKEVGLEEIDIGYFRPYWICTAKKPAKHIPASSCPSWKMSAEIHDGDPK